MENLLLDALRDPTTRRDSDAEEGESEPTPEAQRRRREARSGQPAVARSERAPAALAVEPSEEEAED